jgi:hypothetical protein
LAPKHEANEQFEYLDIDEKIILRYRFTPWILQYNYCRNVTFEVWRLCLSLAPRMLNPWGKNQSSRWTGGWVGPTTSLEALEGRKVSCLNRELKPNPSVTQTVA